jgi:cytochrome oxidase assembly protein ShyY1
MLALLRTSRWVSFTALVLLAIIGFGFLSSWQFDRAEQHREERLAIEQGQIIKDPQFDISGTAEFSRVTMTGQYLGADVLVRQRPLDGGNGYWVLTPLQPNANADKVWVLRGWLSASTQALEVPPIPPAPSGDVTIDGVVRVFEEPRSDVSGLPDQVISRMSSEELSFAGVAQDRVLQLIRSEPEDDLITVPLPEIDEGQNISYAVQWILFALVALGGWFVFLRREAQDEVRNHDLVESEN